MDLFSPTRLLLISRKNLKTGCLIWNLTFYKRVLESLNCIWTPCIAEKVVTKWKMQSTPFWHDTMKWWIMSNIIIQCVSKVFSKINNLINFSQQNLFYFQLNGWFSLWYTVYFQKFPWKCRCPMKNRNFRQVTQKNTKKKSINCQLGTKVKWKLSWCGYS